MAYDKELRELPLAHSYMCLRIEHENDSSIPDDCSCGAEAKASDLLRRVEVEARIGELEHLISLQIDVGKLIPVKTVINRIGQLKALKGEK